MVAVETTITNRGGTIWAGISTDGGSTIHRGIAIDTVNKAGLIQLQGTGHIYGDINIASGNTIEVTDGKTFFEGTIKGNGTLDIFDGGELVLCQEGWTAACDPNGWGDANWDPQQGVGGPSSVFIETLTIETNGTIAYQLTPKTASGTYPQVFANRPTSAELWRRSSCPASTPINRSTTTSSKPVTATAPSMPLETRSC